MKSALAGILGGLVLLWTPPPDTGTAIIRGRVVAADGGAPLARAEVRITLERLLERTSDIRVSEAIHGPVGARRYDYMPTYMFRGVMQLALEFDPVQDGAGA